MMPVKNEIKWLDNEFKQIEEKSDHRSNRFWKLWFLYGYESASKEYHEHNRNLLHQIFGRLSTRNPSTPLKLMSWITPMQLKSIWSETIPKETDRFRESSFTRSNYCQFVYIEDDSIPKEEIICHINVEVLSDRLIFPTGYNLTGMSKNRGDVRFVEKQNELFSIRFLNKYEGYVKKFNEGFKTIKMGKGSEFDFIYHTAMDDLNIRHTSIIHFLRK